MPGTIYSSRKWSLWRFASRLLSAFLILPLPPFCGLTFSVYTHTPHKIDYLSIYLSHTILCIDNFPPHTIFPRKAASLFFSATRPHLSELGWG